MPPHVALREVTDDDVAVFFEQQADPLGIQMVAYTPLEPLDREAFFAKWGVIRTSPTGMVRTIVADGNVAGKILSFLFPKTGEREVGFWLGRSYWGQGIATAALKLFLTQVERRRPLFAGAAVDNLGSLRVLQKCGFQVTGRECDFAPARGQNVDVVLLTLAGDPPA
ncbi:MAG: GNAT family N-acetyltransferase [Planctomycetes bacterium]|nr:GNAT family N-acetyltransferase [Planctomycetota bacterium]